MALAQCLADQETICARFLSLREMLEDPLLSEVEHLTNLAIHQLEEAAVCLEESKEPVVTDHNYPRIFNALFYILEDIAPSETLTRSEITYLVSLSIPQRWTNHLCEYAVAHDLPDFMDALKEKDPSITLSPTLLFEAVRQGRSERVERLLPHYDYETVKEACGIANALVDKKMLMLIVNYLWPEEASIKITLTPELFSDPMEFPNINRFVRR